MVHSQVDMEEEARHFSNVITTFHEYQKYSLSANNRRRKDLYKLPKADQDLFVALGYREKLNLVDEAILKNAEFLEGIVSGPGIFDGEDDDEDAPEDDVEMNHEHACSDDDHSHSHAHTHPEHSHSHDAAHAHSHSHDGPSHGHGFHSPPPGQKYKPTEFDMDKLRSTLKQFVRDWSEEGLPERESCYTPMKDALLEHFKAKSGEEKANLRVLVPGAGLGRLAFDVANLGFHTQGNEFSHYMLLASYFILNRTSAPLSHSIYPYVHTFSNAYNKDTILREIKIPDVEVEIKNGTRFELVAGDFEEIYGQPENTADEVHAGQFDAILTCFFIDTAKNPLSYLRTLHRILAPGGVWINLGPLLWHFENNQTGDVSIELDLNEVKELCKTVGFDLSNEREIHTTYTSNSAAMLGYMYHAQFWTATKELKN
ncbi:N2227-domain-containing protein [Mucidula mucida]|nr:N2227-domain-containing protein [Mucidula mucida]